MIFDEIPLELKEHIFTYVTPNEWINTGKVSNEWMKLTLGSIKKVETCHLLILDHLTEFINQHRNTNYLWVSLLAMMPNLEHLECIENTEAFWQEISPVCHQLKILKFKLGNVEYFDWNNLGISFNNLVELLWEDVYQGLVFPFNLFVFSPKLEKLTLKYVKINAEWMKKIPESVKHILLNNVIFTDENCSVNYLCEDNSALQTFSAYDCEFSKSAAAKFFYETLRLKKLELELLDYYETASMIIMNALRSCQGLETVEAHDVIITDSWRRIIPQNVKSIQLFEMEVQEDIRQDFSLDWLFQNYDCLQSLQVEQASWTGFDPQKFHSPKNLKKLYLHNYKPYDDEPNERFSDICLRMIRGSHLVDVEIYGMTIDESWSHIFPPTIKRLSLKDFRLSKEAQLVFSPQFICENPTNIASLILVNFKGYLPAMDLNAFRGMQMLQELHLNEFRLSGECLQSILTHCSALTDLTLYELEDGALTHTPHNLVLPNLRILDVIEPVDRPSLLLQHFPNVCAVDIAIAPPEACFSAIMKALEVADAVELKIRHLSWDLLSSLVESIDDTKYKYFCLSLASIRRKEFSFYWTNSVLNACRKLNDIIIPEYNGDVLWINNYPSSALLRNNLSLIPSSMDELSLRFHEIMAPKCDDDKE